MLCGVLNRPQSALYKGVKNWESQIGSENSSEISASP